MLLGGVPSGEGAERPAEGAPVTTHAHSLTEWDELVTPNPSPVVIDGAVAERFVKAPSKAMRKRRSVPIMGYIGVSGNGKSASMVRDTLPSLAMGRPVLSTLELLDAHTGNPHPLYVPFRRFSQLTEFRGGDVLMDEITGIMDSHDASMPKSIRRVLPQQRRRGNTVRWSGIDWDNSNRRLRQMTQAVTSSTGYCANRKLVRTDTGEVDAIPMWAPNRLFHLITRDAQLMNKSEDSASLSGATQGAKTRKKKPKILVWELWWGPGSAAFDSYNTLGEVLAVDNGCEVCGLKTVEKTCKGHDGEPSPSRGRRVAIS